jgi:molybdopterin-containing oxidoreductase family membrane subunit
MYKPTFTEAATLIGSFGLFFTCFLLLTRLLPVIAASEVKGVLKLHDGHDAHAEGGDHA